MLILKTVNTQPLITQVDTTFLYTHRFADGKGFPPSYLDFATHWGWGRLCGLFLVYVPLGQHPDSWPVQSRRIREKMAIFYAEMDHDPFLLEPAGYAGLEQALVPFARSENGGYLAWDTTHRDAENEFPIYVLMANLGGIRYGGKNFNQFVKNCTDATRVKDTLGPGYQPLPATFEPLSAYE